MKKLLRNSALIGLFYYLLVIVNACCHCEPERTRFYKTDDINARNIEFKFEGDTSYTYTQVLKDSFQKEIYGIQVQFNSKEIVRNCTKNLGLINSAYACKCSEGNRISKDTIKTIRVITVNNFDASHSAGSDVSDYFKHFDYQYNPTKLVKISIADHLLQEGAWQPFFFAFYYLNQLPDPVNSKVQFEVIVEYKNGKILKDTTPIATLY